MKKAGDLVNIYFNDVQKKQGEQYSNFHNSWKKIAGEKIGLNTKIKDIVDGNLIIEIDHPGWKQLILLKEKYILRQIKKSFPELLVEKMKFHFKTTANVTKKQIIVKKQEENKVIINEIENSGFSDLLKKMSKRSEE